MTVLPDHPRGAETVVTQPVFRCVECHAAMRRDGASYWVCVNGQCANLALPVAVWRAQRRRVERGEDCPAPGSGWPRPLLRGHDGVDRELPHAWVIPVSDGRAWWRALDESRVIDAQNGWLCQVCGLPLGARAWVLLNREHVVSDAALHDRCLDVARRICPHLTSTAYPAREVVRADLRGDGQPLFEVRDYRASWTVADQER